MKKENSQKILEHLREVKLKAGVREFTDEFMPDGYDDYPKPQSWSDIDSIVFDDDRWLINNLIPKEGVSMIASVSGEGKSWQLLHMIKCLISGTPLYDHEGFATKKSKVLFVNLEMSISEIQRRGRLIGFEKDDKNLIILNDDNFNINNYGLQDYKYRWLLGFIAKNEIDVLIIDTFRPSTGRMKEDKAEEVRAFFQKFLILKNAGISVIFTEHLRKPTQLEGKVPKKEQVLGSQDKVSNLEVLLMIRKDEVTGETLIYQRKNRIGVEIKPFAVKLEDVVGLTGTKSIDFKYVGEIEDEATKKEEAKTLIMNVLSSGESKTTNQIIELARKEVGQKNIRNALRELQFKGELNVFKTGKQNTYSLPKEKQNTSEILNDNEMDNVFDSF